VKQHGEPSGSVQVITRSSATIAPSHTLNRTRASSECCLSRKGNTCGSRSRSPYVGWERLFGSLNQVAR
jgi:hypothetical protein